MSKLRISALCCTRRSKVSLVFPLTENFTSTGWRLLVRSFLLSGGLAWVDYSCEFFITWFGGAMLVFFMWTIFYFSWKPTWCQFQRPWFVFSVRFWEFPEAAWWPVFQLEVANFFSVERTVVVASALFCRNACEKWLNIYLITYEMVAVQ